MQSRDVREQEREEDTGQVQVEAILLVSPFVPADDLFDDGGHVWQPGAAPGQRAGPGRRPRGSTGRPRALMLRRLSPGRARLPAAAPAAAPSSSSFSSASSERVGSRAEPLRAVPPPPPCLGRARRRRGEQLCGAPGPGNGDSGAGRAPGPAPLRSPPRGPGGRSLGSSRRRLLRAARPRSSPGPQRSPARGAHHGRGFREGRRAAPPRPRDASANTQSSPSHPATGRTARRRTGDTGGPDRAARAARIPPPAAPPAAPGAGGEARWRRAEGYGR